MASPKGGGGKATAKKAKLAHEKRGQGPQEFAQFRFRGIEGLVEDKQGKGAIVVLDDKGTKGIVDAVYVRTNADGTLGMRPFACPASYDAVANQAALARFAAHAAG